jgi:hypothetical protein
MEKLVKIINENTSVPHLEYKVGKPARHRLGGTDNLEENKIVKIDCLKHVLGGDNAPLVYEIWIEDSNGTYLFKIVPASVYSAVYERN